MVCFKLKRLSWRNNISFKQNTVYIITCKSRLDTNYCQVQGLKKSYARFSHAPNLLFKGIKYHAGKRQLCSFEKGKDHFRYTLWFMISEKKIQWCTFLHCGARRHQKCQYNVNKIAYQKFQFSQPLNYTHVNQWFFLIQTGIYLQKTGISKHI